MRTKAHFFYFFTALSLLKSPLFSQKDAEERWREILRLHRELGRELREWQEEQTVSSLSGENFSLLEGEGELSFSQRERERFKEGKRLFEEARWEEAKEKMQEIWENHPNHALSSYNLGVLYYKLGNLSMAKKMWKSVLELDPQFSLSQSLINFLENSPSSKKREKEEKERNRCLNQKQEILTYLQLSGLSRSQKLRHILPLLEKMKECALQAPSLQREFFPFITEQYSLLSRYGQALETLREYERQMEGRIFPENYYEKKVQLEEKNREERERLQLYLNREVDEKIERKLRKNVEELEIFAVQFDQFVQRAEREDEDFQKIVHRLKEFRWGGKRDRHVLVVNLYEEILFSSLAQMLPLENYRDHLGRAFFQDIVQLSPLLSLKQVHFIALQLPLGKQLLSYILLYTFIPKHTLFIIVKIPQEDLN